MIHKNKDCVKTFSFIKMHISRGIIHPLNIMFPSHVGKP